MSMTTTSIIILIGIGSAFLLFGGVLAWGDFYSRRRPEQQVSAAPEQANSTADAAIKLGKAA
jgi:hypothetical protein